MSAQRARFTDGERLRLQTLAATSVARGRLLLRLDLAAALAADYVRATFSYLFVSHIADSIVDVGPNGLEALFFTRSERARVRIRVTFTADGDPLGERLDDVATPRQLVMIRARRTALAAVAGLYPVKLNMIVVPPPPDLLADTPIEIYLVRAAPAPGDVVVGIHWCVLVSSDGARVLETKPLSRSHLTLPGSNGVPPEDIVITHVLGEAPLEIHAYLSIKHDRAIDVVTLPSKARWRVRGDEITLLG